MMKTYIGQRLAALTHACGLLACVGCSDPVLVDSDASDRALTRVCSQEQRAADFTKLDVPAQGTSMESEGLRVEHPGPRALTLDARAGSGLVLSGEPGQQAVELHFSTGPARNIVIELALAAHTTMMVEAYDSWTDRTVVGEIEAHDSGRLAVSDLLGGVAIEAVHLQLEQGSASLASVAYETPRYINVDLSAEERRETRELDVAGIQLTGSGSLTLRGGLGVGDQLIDSGESVRVEFNGSPARDVYILRSLIGNRNGNAASGDAKIEAFGPDQCSLGEMDIDNGRMTVDVSQLFDRASISALQITSVGDYQVLAGVRYASCAD